jgi:hypothetical protein
MKSINKLIKKLYRFTQNKYFTYFTLTVILLGAFGVRLYKIDNAVADWHSWRQADTASVSKIFVEEGIDLLRPRYHDLSKIQTGYENLEGFRFVEFPAFNLIHVLLYSSFPTLGFNISGRLVSVLFAVLTSYFLYRIGRIMFDKTVGLMAAFFYAFLPFNIYFTRVILPDPMSVSLGVGSVYFFVNYTKSKRLTQLFISSLLMAVAVLVKPNAVFFGVPIIYLALKKYKISNILKNKWLFLAVNIIFIPFLLWRYWMYREELVRGIAHWEWAFNGNGIRFRPSFWNWIFGERLAKLILGYWAVLPFSVGVIAVKRLNIVHAFVVGSLLYVSVFASANVMHDYYQVFIIPSVALALALGTTLIWKSDYNLLITRPGLLAVLGLALALGFYNIRDNYRINDTGILVAGKKADEVLPKDALVIASYNGDTTFLYQTGRSGWPTVTTSIEKMISLGADYYISVNLGDSDTQNFSNRFEEVTRTERFVILDLRREK